MLSQAKVQALTKVTQPILKPTLMMPEALASVAMVAMTRTTFPISNRARTKTKTAGTIYLRPMHAMRATALEGPMTESVIRSLAPRIIGARGSTWMAAVSEPEEKDGVLLVMMNRLQWYILSGRRTSWGMKTDHIPTAQDGATTRLVMV